MVLKSIVYIEVIFTMKDLSNIRLVMKVDKKKSVNSLRKFLGSNKEEFIDCAILMKINESRYKQKDFNFKIGVESLDSEIITPECVNLNLNVESYYCSDLKKIIKDFNSKFNKLCTYGFYREVTIKEHLEKVDDELKKTSAFMYLSAGDIFSMPKDSGSGKLESLYFVDNVSANGVELIELSNADRKFNKISLKEFKKIEDSIKLLRPILFESILPDERLTITDEIINSSKQKQNKESEKEIGNELTITSSYIVDEHTRRSSGEPYTSSSSDSSSSSSSCD